MKHRGLLLAALALVGAFGCGTPDDDPATESMEAPPALTAVTEVGPVKATVSVEPESPLLGDPLTLTLTVEAAPDVTVEMPAFGEALGRFSILDFTPRETTAADGTTIASQRYTLQAPMSGKQRIPPLRLEFLDQRDDSTATGSATAESADDIYRELLTDELTVEIQSVLPEGAVIDELRPAREALAEIRTGFLARFWPLVLLGAVLIVGLIWFVPFMRRRARERARITAFDRAMRRLQQLEQRGLPASEEEDSWYVELSDIVRHYLEDRYGLRAPERTTEEFLKEAQRTTELTSAHRDQLSPFLEHCDRVKFAQYHPDQSESRQSLDLARRFLEETRIGEDDDHVESDRTAA